MTNILGDEKRQDVLALGRFGWTLRRTQKATGVRRETTSAYLQAAGIAIRAPRHHQLSAKPASEVSTDPGAPPPGISGLVSAAPPPGRAPAASATCTSSGDAAPTAAAGPPTTCPAAPSLPRVPEAY